MIKIIRNFTLTCVLFGVTQSAFACWDTKEISEIDGFSEMEGKLVLSFKDAVNCKPVVGASVFLGTTEFKSNEKGYVELPMAPFEQVMDKNIELGAIKKGYITLKTELKVRSGTILNKRFALSRALPPGKLRFVLQWGDQPQDLDLHLISRDFHVSYQNKRYIPNLVKLDRDARHGYGPETITLDKMETNEVYSLWVDDYSQTPGFQGNERVDLYADNHLVKSIQLSRGSYRSVHVADIKNGEVQIIKQASSQRP